MQHNCNGEKEIELELEKDLDQEKRKKRSYQNKKILDILRVYDNNNNYN